MDDLEETSEKTLEFYMNNFTIENKKKFDEGNNVNDNNNNFGNINNSNNKNNNINNIIMRSI